MSFLSWLLIGGGLFLLYSAYKGNNPINVIASRFGIETKAPAKIGGQ